MLRLLIKCAAKQKRMYLRRYHCGKRECLAERLLLVRLCEQEACRVKKHTCLHGGYNSNSIGRSQHGYKERHILPRPPTAMQIQDIEHDGNHNPNTASHNQKSKRDDLDHHLYVKTTSVTFAFYPVFNALRRELPHDLSQSQSSENHTLSTRERLRQQCHQELCLSYTQTSFSYEAFTL